MSCLACDLTEGRQELPGGRILETSGWIVEHTVGPLGIGTLIVKTKRHLLSLADLDEREAAELGPLLHRATGLVRALVEPLQVYVCLWSATRTEPVHVHFVVQPVTIAQMDALDAQGPWLQAALFGRSELPPRAEVESFADHARALLAHS